MKKDFLKDWGKGGHTKAHLIEYAPRHTPGPWRYDEQLEQVRAPEGYKNSSGLTLSYHHKNPALTSGEQLANARLISAAPELLEALKAALPLIEYNAGIEKLHGLTTGNHKLLLTIEAAIAKAEGNHA